MTKVNQKNRGNSKKGNVNIRLWVMLYLVLNSMSLALGDSIPPELLPEKCPAPPNDYNEKKEAFVPVYPESNIQARNITGIEKLCTWKTVGKSKGRICCWDKVWHFLKYEVDNFRLLEMYNLMLVRENFNLMAPKVEYVLNEGNFAISADRILNLQTGKVLGIAKIQAEKYRKRLIKQIGETGFEQLQAVSSVISDLTLENWGFVGNILHLIDVDGGLSRVDGSSMQPRNLIGYLTLGRSVFQFDESRLPLTLNNLINIKSIYVGMLNKTAPKLHPSVDMSPQLYHDIFSNYVDCFDLAIKKIQGGNPNVDPTKPNLDYNDAVSWIIQGRIEKIKEMNGSPQMNFSSITNTSGILAGLTQAAGLVANAMNNTTQNLTNISTASMAILANQTLATTQNATESLVKGMGNLVMNTTTALVNATLKIELPAVSPTELMNNVNQIGRPLTHMQSNYVANQQVLSTLSRIEENNRLSLVLQSAAYLTIGVVVLCGVAYQRNTFGLFSSCKKRKLRKLNEVIVHSQQPQAEVLHSHGKTV